LDQNPGQTRQHLGSGWLLVPGDCDTNPEVAFSPFQVTTVLALDDFLVPFKVFYPPCQQHKHPVGQEADRFPSYLPWSGAPAQHSVLRPSRRYKRQCKTTSAGSPRHPEIHTLSYSCQK